ncbi:zinc finger SWIM domain-containing protein 7 [Elephas maximus indicus]|uniref:zinc finger SWIM domain-containing protein 7 n=1 Tax=Elephas maximus indicus TaxID=99487 RepID=UPI002116A15A|nr:zinc finger SWIM domain-containing protein 7 [Elephas maximus indicus]
MPAAPSPSAPEAAALTQVLSLTRRKGSSTRCPFTAHPVMSTSTLGQPDLGQPDRVPRIPRAAGPQRGEATRSRAHGLGAASPWRALEEGAEVTAAAPLPAGPAAPLPGRPPGARPSPATSGSRPGTRPCRATRAEGTSASAPGPPAGAGRGRAEQCRPRRPAARRRPRPSSRYMLPPRPRRTGSPAGSQRGAVPRVTWPRRGRTHARPSRSPRPAGREKAAPDALQVAAAVHPGEGAACGAMSVTLPAVVEELLSDMAAAVRESGRIPDEHLLSLKFVFGSSAIQALDLVDRQSITLISSPSGRRVFQVLGSSGKTYTCLASCHYCSCPAFAFSVLRKSDSLLCKHLLAVYLSQVTGACQQLSVSDEQLTDILLTEAEQEHKATD